MGAFINPILSEIDAAHSRLSPQAQKAIALSGVAPSPAAGAPEAVAANGAAAAPAAGAPAPIAPRPIAGPTPMRGLGPAPAQPDPAQTQRVGELNRLTTGDTAKSGINQIHNPWARIPLQVADAIGTGFFPRLAMGIPGTQLHHNMLVHMQNNAVNEGEKLQTGEVEREHLGAETAGLPAKAELEQAQADALKHPKPKYGNPIATPEGYVVPNETTSEATPLTVGGKQAQPAVKPTVDKYTYQQTDHGLLRIDSQTGEATPVMLNGQAVGGKPAHENDFEQFYKDYLEENKAADSAHTRMAARKAWAAASQAPERPQHDPQALMIGPDGTAMVVRPGMNVPQGSQTTAGVNAASTPTMQMRNVAAQAQLVHEQTPHMLSELDRLKDKIGPMSGRWNEFMQGRVGMNDPDFAGLRADLLMYSSAVALMHARGRLPENLREEFDHMINNPGQQGENLKTVINRIDDWTSKNMHTMRGDNAQGGQPAGGVPKPGETFNGHKVLKVEKVQ